MSNFKPSKLSRASIDAYVKKHGSKEPIKTDHFCTTFKTESGETYHLDPTSLFLEHKLDEFTYLLGQTVPAHTYKAPLKDLARIKNEDGSVENWTRDPKLMADFTCLVTAFSLATILKGEDGRPVVAISQRVKPVIHKERLTDDSDPHGEK